MSCEEMSGLYELYALGILDPEEKVELEDHLRTNCVTCSAELRRSLYRNAMLAAVVEQVEPPVRVRRRVLAGIGIERSRTLWVGAWAMATACLVILAAVLIMANHRQRELGDVMSMLSEPDTRQVDFGNAPAAVAKGKVYVNARRGVLLTASGLAPAPSGKTYEFWLIPKGGAPQPAGLFEAGSDGEALHFRKGPLPGNSAAVAVSVEPSGGSPAPTTKPILVIAL